MSESRFRRNAFAASLGLIAAASLARGGQPALDPKAVPPAEPVAAVEALIAKEPRSLSGLEAIVGSLHRDPKVWKEAIGPLDRKDPSPAVRRARVALDIDVFHFDPQKTPDPMLGSYELDFDSGREAALRRLREAFGEPTALTREGRATMRFGERFFVLGTAGTDQLTLLWHASEPEFAIPQRTPQETSRLVADFVAIVQGRFARSAIEARLGKLVYDKVRGADMVKGGTWELRFAPAGSAVPEDVYLTFKRPLPAEGLLPVLHVKLPRVSAFDVHQQSRTLVDLGRPVPWDLQEQGYDLSIDVSAKTLVKASEPFEQGQLWVGKPLEIEGIRISRPRR
jgi:hypothetical protein